MRLEWAPIAIEDLRGIHRYLWPRNRAAASRMVRLILDAVERLAEHPELGAVAVDLQPEGRYRHLVVSAYRVIYRPHGTWLAVLRIWDGRRDPEELDTFEGG